jgi:hypothetical protein
LEAYGIGGLNIDHLLCSTHIEMATQQIDRPTVKSEPELLGWFILFFVLLSVEGTILSALGVIGQFDNPDPSWLNGDITAYIIVIVTFLIWGGFIALGRSAKNRVRNLGFLLFGGGMAMILLACVFQSIYYAAEQVAVFKNNAQMAQVFQKTTKVLAMTTNPVFSSDDKPLGLHIEYAIEQPNGANTNFSGIDLQYPAGSFLNMYSIPDPSSSLPERIMPDQSGTSVSYGSFDIFPDSVIARGKDIRGHIIFCFASPVHFPQAFNVSTTATLLFDAAITTSTNVSFTDISAFFATASQGTQCISPAFSSTLY